MKLKRIFQFVIPCLLSLVLIISGSFAIMSSVDAKTNVINFGNVKITIEENGWLKGSTVINDANQNGITDFAENFYPRKIIDKPTIIKNVGENTAWVVLKLTVSTHNLPYKTTNLSEFTDLYNVDRTEYIPFCGFTIKDKRDVYGNQLYGTVYPENKSTKYASNYFNEDWVILETDKTHMNITNGYIIYYLGYNRPIAPNETIKPYDGVQIYDYTFYNSYGDKIVTDISFEPYIRTDAYALQADFNNEVSTVEEAWTQYQSIATE